jgi:hypothetical protein
VIDDSRHLSEWRRSRSAVGFPWLVSAVSSFVPVSVELGINGMTSPSHTPASRFPAVGSSGVTSLLKARATNPRLQPRVAAEKGFVVLPRQPRPARSAIEPLVPEFERFPDRTALE